MHCGLLHFILHPPTLHSPSPPPTAVNINIMPRNLTVQEGQYANFTCEVPCSHSAYWYVGDLYNSAPLPYTDVVPGITYTRSIIGPCAPSAPGNYTDRISILATADLDRIAVQCSASRIICDANDASCGDIVYSRFRTLRGEFQPALNWSVSTPECVYGCFECYIVHVSTPECMYSCFEC